MTPCNNSAHKTGEASPANQPLTPGLPVVTIGGVCPRLFGAMIPAGAATGSAVQVVVTMGSLGTTAGLAIQQPVRTIHLAAAWSARRYGC